MSSTLPTFQMPSSDVQAGDAAVLTHEHLGDDPASVEFISAERIDGDPLPTPKAATPSGPTRSSSAWAATFPSVSS